MPFTRLANRAVVKVSGEDRAAFLQGLISNDVKKIDASTGIWSGFLTPQGKFLHDLFIVPVGDDYWVDVEADRADAFAKKLMMFKLKSKVTITRVPELGVYAVWGEGALDGLSGPGAVKTVKDGAVIADPRLTAMGARALVADPSVLGSAEAPFAEWDALRIGLGIPDGSRDLIVEGSLLLEAGFDELGGVDFKKGCYMGQETTTRSKHRNLIKKRLVPVQFEGATPEVGAPITLGGVEAGEVRSTLGSQGLAIIRLEQFKAASEGGVLTSGATTVKAVKPDWAVFPAVE